VTPRQARACLIDVYDTILSSQFVPRMEDLVAPLGIPVDGWLAEWDKLREDRDRGRVSTATSFTRTLRALGVDPEPGLLADLMRRDAELARAYTRLYEDTVPFLEWLRSNGIATALVSNCEESTRGRLEYLGVIPLVDAVVLSCEVGSMKPFPEIYTTALDELGVAAVDAVFIDDQPTYCVGAQAVGIRPIQIVRGEAGDYVSQWNFPLVHSLFDASSLLGEHLNPAGPGKLPFGTLRGHVRDRGRARRDGAW
jgi:HAD superfamily hydrolase (TIGR01509 family)